MSGEVGAEKRNGVFTGVLCATEEITVEAVDSGVVVSSVGSSIGRSEEVRYCCKVSASSKILSVSPSPSCSSLW